jgi:hypothetical protein
VYRTKRGIPPIAQLAETKGAGREGSGAAAAAAAEAAAAAAAGGVIGLVSFPSGLESADFVGSVHWTMYRGKVFES